MADPDRRPSIPVPAPRFLPEGPGVAPPVVDVSRKFGAISLDACIDATGTSGSGAIMAIYDPPDFEVCAVGCREFPAAERLVTPADGNRVVDVACWANWVVTSSTRDFCELVRVSIPGQPRPGAQWALPALERSLTCVVPMTMSPTGRYVSGSAETGIAALVGHEPNTHPCTVVLKSDDRHAIINIREEANHCVPVPSNTVVMRVSQRGDKLVAFGQTTPKGKVKTWMYNVTVVDVLQKRTLSHWDFLVKTWDYRYQAVTVTKDGWVVTVGLVKDAPGVVRTSVFFPTRRFSRDDHAQAVAVHPDGSIVMAEPVQDAAKPDHSQICVGKVVKPLKGEVVTDDSVIRYEVQLGIGKGVVLKMDFCEDSRFIMLLLTNGRRMRMRTR